MTNGFPCEVRYAHAADILFVHFKFMVLTYGMSVRHDISKQGVYALFSNKKKRKTFAWFYIVLLVKDSSSWCFFVSF